MKVPDLVGRAVELEMDAVAVTDHGNMFGAVELQQKCGGSGVKPIFGVEVNVVADRMDPGARPRPYHLVLLAETLDGYRNLVRLVSHSWLDSVDRRGRPLVDYALLTEYNDGILALSGDLGGEIPLALLRRDRKAAVDALHRYLGIFGRDHFFLELQRTEGIPEQQDACDMLVELADEYHVPYVATNNVHYLRGGDHEAHAVLMCIGMEKRIDRTIIEKIPLRSLYLKDLEEMNALFEDLPLALRNSRLIADRCNVEIPTGTNYLPAFPVPDGFDEPSYLRHIAAEGLDRRFDELRRYDRSFDEAVYRERLSSELAIIESMGFPGYFLIVWDFIRWTREQDIPVGPGRGSGAGSLVAWSLWITDLDPIRYGLLFERFLNPERVSMPDFDIDFCQSRRGEVIDYVTQKYGVHNVGQIVTFGQMKARAAVRDVARVLNVPYAETDRLAKLVPDELNIKLADAYDREPRLREAINEDPTIGFLYETALALEGNNRNSGMHAAGVVISGEPLWEYVPILKGTNDEIVTQYAKNEVEAAGLVKFDFLGLKTLTVIDDAVRLVNRDRPAEEHLDLPHADLDQSQVYEVIKSGDTTGIFQMESEGFQRLIRQLKPDCFEDIVAAVALYRPGPLGSGMVEQFIDCKHGRRAVEYPHPWLEDVLRETYGVMVYQEQVMQVAQILAGYSLGQADILRRAMGKKKPEEMARQREVFVAGARTKEVGAAKANEIFDLMAHFAGYGFNKSHSAAYAVLTFQTAYLKRFHPTEFYASLMTNDASSTAKVVKYILDARSRDIQVLPPDVDASEQSFSVAGGAIRFGLGAVKGIGSGPIEAIAEARTDEGFASLYDFCERVDLKRCSKRVIEALVRCGAFDTTYADGGGETPTLKEIGRWRARMFAVIDPAYDRGARAQSDRESGQSSLFGMFAEALPASAPVESYPDVRGWTDKHVLTCEKESLGFYVSGHPLDRYRDEIRQYTTCSSSTLDTLSNNADVVIAGVVSSKNERPLRNGDGRMAFLQFEDHFGDTEVAVYSREYEEFHPLLDADEPLIVRGRVRIEGDGDERVWKVVAREIQPLYEARNQRVKEVHVGLTADHVDQGLLGNLHEVIARHPGHCRAFVTIDFGTADATYALPDDVLVASSEELLHDIAESIGDVPVRFR